jgi:hypothetical protein
MSVQSASVLTKMTTLYCALLRAYTKDMSLFVQPTTPPLPKTKNTRYVSLALAGVFIVLAVAQLYSFEDFPDTLASLGLIGGRQGASLVAALLVTGEVLALPFLLSMRLSPAMRALSMAAGWGVLVAWLTIAVLINSTTNAITNSGVLGATISTTPGWWMAGVFLALAVMAAWASWGMWPWRQHAPEAARGDTK